MCYTLSAEKILLNYFAAEPESIEVSFEEISILSCKIVQKCNNSIITRISTEDIKDAVSQRANVFKLVGASVVLLNQNNYLFKNIDILNQAMPKFVKESCEEVCLEYAKTR
ncbi:MAG: hypothetical protein LBS04_01995 [Tannerellaceae bacterium]|jgi:hypothetical protein|nr:hypothetical protein [Tannerellaceae bacterium]